MCGIFGSFGNLPEISKDSVAECLRLLRVRGPDGENFERGSCFGFGHTRLSIQDVSQNGMQPMYSRSERSIIIYNGEIYNISYLKKWLNHMPSSLLLTGNSDTEILIECIEKFGIEETLDRVDGMFAFAYINLKNQTMHLARDRFGEKPIYYTLNKNGTLYFGSTVAVINEMVTGLKISVSSISDILDFGFIRNGKSIYAGVNALKPGTVVTVKNTNNGLKFSEKCFAKVSEVHKNSQMPSELNFQESLVELDRLIDSSVQRRLAGDVEVGCLLSGGIDSSLVAYYASKNISKLRTYSAGFEDANFDESIYAERTAKYIGTKHETVHVNDKNALDYLTSINDVFSEPFADTSQIPTFILCKHVGNAMKVALTGDGADEIFRGYTRYQTVPKLNKILKYLPTQSVSNQKTDNYLYFDALTSKLLHKKPKLKSRLQILIKTYQNMKDFDIYDAYRRNAIPSNEVFLLSSKHNKEVYGEISSIQMQQRDYDDYLPNDVLVKSDRCSMANSLELRTPFLEDNLLKFGFKLPKNYLQKNGSGKHILRQLAYEKMDQGLLDRPKNGFSAPISFWLRHGFKDWAFDTLSSSEKKLPNVFDYEKIRKIYAMHLYGKDFGAVLWPYFITMNWLISQSRIEFGE
jgi:asparagine synthase (glutamine-hydrolysing)